MKRWSTAIIVAFLAGVPAIQALEDTQENRAKETDRYLAATPASEMMEDMTEAMSMNLPPSERDEFRRLLTEYVDLDRVTEAMRSSMIRNFTADELAAMADLFESPEGKSAMKKMGSYMAEVMPVIEAEVMRAIGQLQRDKAEENRQLPDGAN